MKYKLFSVKNCARTSSFRVQHLFRSCNLPLILIFVLTCSLYLMYARCYTEQTGNININNTVTTKLAIIHWKKLKQNLDCYYSVKDDALPAAETANISQRNNSIFFVETSCRNGINSREACAIESAARLHPNRHVNVLFTSPITDAMLKNSALTILTELSNVKLSRIHVQEYGKGTDVEGILSKDLKRSKHPVEHASDIMRFLTLYKYGGVYLDTDSILLKNLDPLPLNWVAKESSKDMAVGIVALSKDKTGARLSKALLRELRNKFQPRVWGANGPKLMARVLQRLCPKTLTSSDHCRDLKIFPSKYFYPVPYRKYRKYFKNGTIDGLEEAYMHHMWNFLSKNLKIEKASPFAKLARKNCPSIYNMYGDEFGV